MTAVAKRRRSNASGGSGMVRSSIPQKRSSPAWSSVRCSGVASAVTVSWRRIALLAVEATKCLLNCFVRPEHALKGRELEDDARLFLRARDAKVTLCEARCLEGPDQRA